MNRSFPVPADAPRDTADAARGWAGDRDRDRPAEFRLLAAHLTRRAAIWRGWGVSTTTARSPKE